MGHVTLVCTPVPSLQATPSVYTCALSIYVTHLACASHPCISPTHMSLPQPLLPCTRVLCHLHVSTTPMHRRSCLCLHLSHPLASSVPPCHITPQSLPTHSDYHNIVPRPSSTSGPTSCIHLTHPIPCFIFPCLCAHLALADWGQSAFKVGRRFIVPYWLWAGILHISSSSPSFQSYWWHIKLYYVT